MRSFFVSRDVLYVPAVPEYPPTVNRNFVSRLPTWKILYLAKRLSPSKSVISTLNSYKDWLVNKCRYSLPSKNKKNYSNIRIMHRPYTVYIYKLRKCIYRIRQIQFLCVMYTCISTKMD